MEKKRMTIEEIEKMVHSDLVCTQTIKLSDDVFGDTKKHTLTFDVFDGFAYCGDYNGKEYYMLFPRLSLIKLSKTMSASVREFMGLGESDEIGVTDVMASYYTLYCND